MSPRGSAGLELVRLTYGGFLLAAPSLLPHRVLDEQVGPGTRRVMQVLGARHVVQGIGILALGSTARRLGGIADLIHLASLLPIGLLSGRKRLCAADAVFEAAFGAGELALGRRAARMSDPS